MKEAEQFKEAITAAGNTFADQVNAKVKALQQSVQTVYELTWQAYLYAGTPYGESRDGLLRWLKELGGATGIETGEEKENYG